ncbi:nucleoside hydrolase [Rhodococcus triatomae]|uniref:Purine nucleosidase n=1 Tax=Rhodococcus triatomae TaxID=300028 RepID=A0A1G8K738_9NOCA|nr:nucleoside hydrolase [Rhodococcus triatomae]QNG25246.1 nucleoside hydrolase [Rhodococcus triatomae]SDI39254.1 purine nucleosidase [Rhodococcus triatomae]
MRTPLIVDVDTGIDDSLALVYLLASPDADILGIVSTAGNVPAAQVARNNLAWLDVCDAPDLEVALGAATPLSIPLRTTEDTHGPEGVGYAVLPDSPRSLSTRTGVDLWIDTVRARPGEVTGLVTGPLTTLALAVREDPELPRLLQRLVVMGGAFHHPGNTTPTTEWNVSVDPEAAKEVFDAFSGLPAGRRPVVCGLDVTETVEMHPEHVRLLAEAAGSAPAEVISPDDLLTVRSHAGNPVIRHLSDAIRFYMDFHRTHDQGFLAHMHDPFAAAVALGRVPVTVRPATIDVELAGTLTRGMTVADWVGHWSREPNADIVVGTDPVAFFEELIGRVGRYARGRSRPD